MNIFKSPRTFISIALISFAVLFTGCTMTMPDGTTHNVGIAQKLGSIIYNPVYTNEQIGVNIGTKEKITGHKVVTVTNPDGTTETIREPIIEIVPVKDPVFKNIVTSWEPNLLGQGLKFLASAIPIPGAEEAAGGALLLGSLGMGTQEVLRRKKKKITDSNASQKDKEIAIARAEKEAAESLVEIAVEGVEEFAKSEHGKVIIAKGIEEGKALGKVLKEKVEAEAGKVGLAKPFKKLVKALT